MTEEKPLHVRVAEALGWHPPLHTGGISYDIATLNGDPVVTPPRYDTDWAATGPLIEKYVRSVHNGKGWVCENPEEWNAVDVGDTRCGRGKTPLIAVCNLILALAAAGKLKESA